jgi:hypothetical protein
MAQKGTPEVKGAAERLRLRWPPTRKRRYVRATLRKAGESVRSAQWRFDRYDARSARGYRIRVRQRGIAVEQSLRKTTGKHPEFGALQMKRALVPSLEANEHQVEQDFEHALDLVCDHFNGTSI